MTSVKTSAEPFGAFRLPGWLEAVRLYANTLSDTFYGRRCASLIRKLCFRLRGDGPFDIPLFYRQSARVYPRSNRCEKRAFAGIGSWDRNERAYLEGRMLGTDPDLPFVFIDAGANVGFYSLFAVDLAKRLSRPVQVVAIEPDPTNRGRLSFNVDASGAAAQIAISPYALGGDSRTATLVGGERNRGEVHLADAIAGSIEIEVRPLAKVLADHQVTRIDALKLDIEGVEHETLQAFFATKPFEMWPETIILEVGRSGTSDAFELCRSNGYMPSMSARINSILRRPASPPTALDA